jgi:16S rRNA (uracil1498-N3)-methyltransferase
MSRELRRLLIAPDRIAKGCSTGSGDLRIELESRELHYLTRVLRYHPGDRLAVVDGCGRLWSAVLETEGRLRWEQPFEAPLAHEERPSPALELAMAVPRREADLVWRMATELGAARLQPLLARRGVPGERCPVSRWQEILREASEQCERLWLPELLPPLEAGPWLAQPVEGVALLATTRRQGLKPLLQVLQDLWEPSLRDSLTVGVRLAVGPEGGWTPEEEQLAEAAGWRPVSLGPSILRTATAAVSGLALLAGWCALSCASCRRPSL